MSRSSCVSRSGRVAVLLAGLALGGGLPGCAVAPAEAVTWDIAPTPTVARSRDQLRRVHALVDGWSDAERVMARELTARLLVDCPYNRATAQLPLVLHRSLGSLEGIGLEPAQQAELRALQDGLVVHRALVDRITGGELPPPTMVDHLDQLDPWLLPSVHELTLDADPVSRSQALVDRVNDIVRDYPPHVAQRIDEANQRLAELTSAPPSLLAQGPVASATGAEPPPAWPLDRVFHGWRLGLEGLLPQLSDPGERQRVEAALALLEAFLGSRC